MRLTSGSGSVTITPAASQEYTLYSVNASGQAYQTINAIMPAVPMAPPNFSPPAGTYSNATVVAIQAPGISGANHCVQSG